jgi:hypothetical protein
VTQPVSAYRYFSFTVFSESLRPCAWLLLFRLIANRGLVRVTSYILTTAVTCWITANAVESWRIPAGAPAAERYYTVRLHFLEPERPEGHGQSNGIGTRSCLNPRGGRAKSSKERG